LAPPIAKEKQLRTVFATKDVHPRDRFDYWHSVACREVVIHDSLPLSRPRFEAAIEAGSVGELDVVAFETSPLKADRTLAHISRGGSDELFLCLQARGVLTVEQDARKLSLRAGQMTLLDPSLPYSADFSGDPRSVVLKLPRQELQARVGKTRNMLARLIRAGSLEDNLMSSFTETLSGLAGKMRRASEDLVADFMLDLIAMSLANTMRCTTPRISSTKAMLIMEIRAAVKARLADPDLNVQTIADAVGLSVRYANNILSSQDTSIGRLILTERLERCRQFFEDPAQAHRTISEVAFGWGFSDLTHFGRCFKKAYGMSPSDFQVRHRKK
jgi:AraC-like DNA-binding protein